MEFVSGLVVRGRVFSIEGHTGDDRQVQAQRRIEPRQSTGDIAGRRWRAMLASELLS